MIFFLLPSIFVIPMNSHARQYPPPPSSAQESLIQAYTNTQCTANSGEPGWPSGKALLRLVSKRTSARFRFISPLSSIFVVCGHCLVTLSLTVNETLKWLASLPVLMQESFWWFNSKLFTSTETVQTVRYGEPKMSISTFLQLLSSGGDSVALVKVSLFPRLLGSPSPPVHLRRQLGVQQV